MIGRGTRIRPDLFGRGKDKTHFLIFDYLGNFEFFRENKDGIEASDTTSTQASIFAKRVRLIFHLQDVAFDGEEYQALRRDLVKEVTDQIARLSLERVDVRLKRKYVDKYNSKEAFTCLSEQDKLDLIVNIADLVTMTDMDDKAVEFDNLMYGLMLAHMEGLKSVAGYKKATIAKATALLKKTTIPQVKAKIPLLKEVVEEEFWSSAEILGFERIRRELRDLMKFIVIDSRIPIYTDLVDKELERIEMKEFKIDYDLEDYRLKVNRYIEENKNNIAIHKLRNNIPLSVTDYKMLEKIFTGELGTREDYEKSYHDTPFGLLVRRIAKMEREAASQAFSSFINEQNLNANQIVFVNKVIDYIEQNGYVESVAELTRPPFDKPQGFVKLFDPERQQRLVSIINGFKENATKIIS
jgi:type I restriction enzyme R subunit